MFFKPYSGDYSSAMSIPFAMLGYEVSLLKVDWDIRLKAQDPDEMKIEIQGNFAEGNYF